MRMIVILICVW